MLESKVPVRSNLPVRVPQAARQARAQRMRRQWTPLLGAGAALVLAGLGELLVESGNTSIVSLVLYAVAIGLFTWSAWLLPPAPADLPVAEARAVPAPVRQRRGWLILGGGVALAVLVNVITFFQLRADIKAGAAPWLWAGSLLILLGAGLAAGRVGLAP